MGDTDHIARFREGARAWNAWRAEYPGITPDLRDFVPNLGEKQLGPAHGGPIDLSASLLNGANLHGATLIEAQFANADLRLANLTMALLPGADLSYANLGGAVFDHADLADASLRGAIVDGARLELARNLTQAQIDAALGNVDTVLPADLHVPATWLAFDYLAGMDLPPEPDDDFFEAEPHEVLGLAPKASAEEIRRAYLRLAKKYHPDVNPGDLIAERRFKTINEAYHQLTTPEPKPRQQRRAPPWAAAAILFVIAFTGPSLAVYWWGMSPFKEPREARPQAERTEKSSDRLAALPQRPVPPSEADYTSALPASPPAAVASQGSEPSVAFLEERNAAMLQEAESQRIKTAAELQFAIRPAADERLTGSALMSGGASMSERALIANVLTGSGAPDRIVPVTGDGSAPPPERMAALQPALPTPAETGTAPWDDEWAGLRGSNALLALHSFIQRYREKPPADEARDRFRTVVAALESVDELKKFVRETVEDSPERALVKRQLALLVEREAVEGDKKAWDETRETGSIAALRAYLLSFPNGRHVDQAEERLAALEEEANGRKKDSAAWARALRASTRAGYEAYLKAQPDGRYVDDAKRKMASLAAAESTTRKEDEAWARASKERTRRAYYAYLNAYPNGRYVGMAQETIEKAERPPRAEPRRTASDTPRGQRGSGPRWPSSDEPFIERIQGAQ
jgi:curved DNA-binding protein CbpA